ncbi:hypothetical protein ABW20_dc0107979 [Dactylellina cionopaga]|nr:hypothetical protein ABW20_dc0107979 [Dactylellina cionopaga]
MKTQQSLAVGAKRILQPHPLHIDYPVQNTNMNENMSPGSISSELSLLELPGEILKLIALALSPRDCKNLASTCNELQLKLGESNQHLWYSHLATGPKRHAFKNPAIYGKEFESEDGVWTSIDTAALGEVIDHIVVAMEKIYSLDAEFQNFHMIEGVYEDALRRFIEASIFDTLSRLTMDIVHRWRERGIHILSIGDGILKLADEILQSGGREDNSIRAKSKNILKHHFGLDFDSDDGYSTSGSIFTEWINSYGVKRFDQSFSKQWARAGIIISMHNSNYRCKFCDAIAEGANGLEVEVSSFNSRAPFIIADDLIKHVFTDHPERFEEPWEIPGGILKPLKKKEKWLPWEGLFEDCEV